MITVIICGIIFAILIFINSSKDRLNDKIDICVNSFFGFLIGAFIGIMIAFILPMDLKIKETNYQLEVLSDNISTNGDFFLGSGNIDGTIKYTFYYKSNGFVYLKQVEYYKAKIKYTNNEPPTVTLSKKTLTKSLINKFAFDCDYIKQTFIFNIPEGSIKNNYNLDAK